MNWNELIALFGGTFDPPHAGHLEAMRGLFATPGVKHVLVLASPSPPHKPCFATAEHRIEMTRLLLGELAGDPNCGEVKMDIREIKRAFRNPGTLSYTFDTLKELRRDSPKLAFVIGADQLGNLHRWHRFPDVLSLANWIVLDRKFRDKASGETAGVLRQWEASGILRKENDEWRIARSDQVLGLFPTKAPPLSSTAIREAIAKTGVSPEGSLPKKVMAYLKEHRLYGAK